MKIKRISPEKAKITLLTLEQAEKLPTAMLQRDCWWWLQGPSDLAFVAVAFSYDGSECVYRNVRSDCTGVVPAFQINNLRAKFGDKVYVGKLCCTVVGDNLVLSDKIVCEHCFDKATNDWKKSELKAFIESEDFAEKYILDNKGISKNENE